MTKTRWSHLVIALLAITVVGCSDGARGLSPIGPSPLAEVPTTASSPTAATAASWARANGWSTMADGRVAVADGIAVEAVEVMSSVSGTCPSRTMTVRGVPVGVTASTTYSAPLTCASLAGGTMMRITGVLIYTAGGFSVTATHLAAMGAEDSSRAPSTSRSGEKLSGEGVVGPVTGGCPSLTFVLMGYRVQTTDGTAYGPGSSCEGLREGMQIRLDVDRQPDGTIYADRIEFMSVPGRRE